MKINLVLLLLAALLAVPTWLTVRAERARFTEIKDLPLLFDGFDQDAVAGFGIAKGWNDPGTDPSQQRPIEELQFRRGAGGRWVLANTELMGAPVRTDKVVDEVLEHLGRIRRDEKAVHRAKATPEELKQFGLTRDDGYLIVAFDAQNRMLADLVVGKEVSGGQWEGDRVRGRFVRARANESVLVYETDFFAPSVVATEWLDQRIYQADLSKTVGFKLSNATSKEPVAFTKERPDLAEWQVAQAPPNTGAPRQGDLQTLVQKLSILDAARILAPLQPEVLKSKGLEPSKIGLDPPDCAVTYTLQGGETITLEVGRKLEDKPEAYARCNSSPFLFTVPDWMRSDLEVNVSTLFGPPPDALREDKPPSDGKGDKDAKETKDGK